MKASVKKRRHLRSLAFLRIHRSRKDSVLPVSTPQDANFTSTRILELILKRELGTLRCLHVLVGSSSFHRFLKGQYDLEKAHSSMRARMPSGCGLSGEQAFARMNDYRFYQPFAILKRLPFVCSTPDFFITTPKLTLFEIKTTTTLKSCRNLFSSLPRDYFLQVWISMEIFGVRLGKVYIYHYETRSDRLNKYGQRKFVKLYGIVNLHIDYLEMLEDIRDLAIDRYLDFLAEYFVHFQIEFSSESRAYERQMLLQCFKRHNRLNMSLKNIRNIISIKDTGNETSACFELADMKDQEENFGTKDRQKHDQEFYKDIKQNLKNERSNSRTVPSKQKICT